MNVLRLRMNDKDLEIKKVGIECTFPPPGAHSLSHTANRGCEKKQKKDERTRRGLNEKEQEIGK